ncbi:S-adenosyl-L-methionine-dependent methyltransferase [Halteromyces radiatus]|uniref:S-adenosyl-L-methionine-dependent methyltransferase n=1 Tax=Halteromyces radiatus TaxID=101107 RepID=UPI0022205665|nr:S-adenosyl-L-methionine-dependent methyltransferase [Halteromyces radiatus]KAI8086612.1 S-adenosyl-L-methionine-dependent methyltransferase [Halteromyces radiatus]
MNFYQHAGQIIDKLGRHEGTIKGLVLGDPKVKDKKKMYALVCETLKYKHILNEIIDTTNICVIEKKLKRSLALVLIHDLLFSKRGIPVNSQAPLKQCITRHQARLKAELVKIKIKKGANSNIDLLSQKSKDAVHIPRYVRVNEHKSTVENMIKAFEKEGYTYVDTPKDLRSLGHKSFCRDAHLKDLLVFPPKTDLHIHPKYVAGEIILQDKASCFPAHVAQIPTNVHAIDACAAPGNKTSHLSALMKNTGRIWAFDLDQRRLQTLKKLTTKAGCRNIEAIHGSFLDADPSDPMYNKVEYLLLDPSCSGSGIVSRLDHLVDDDSDEQKNADGTTTTQEERLQNLSDFQISIIEHALKFPNAKRIVYSTCSIHPQENEKVVETILSRHPEFTLATRDSVLPTWERRGFPEEMKDYLDQSNCVVRTLPSEDLTNGFFVACFVRSSSPTGTTSATIITNHNKKRSIEETGDQKSNLNKKKKNKGKKRKGPITL